MDSLKRLSMYAYKNRPAKFEFDEQFTDIDLEEEIVVNNNKRFEGLWNATAEKRYKHFVTYTVDYESAWLLANDDGFATIDVDGYIHLLVWPAKEFAVAYSEEDTPIEMDIHEFCERCEDMMHEENIRFMVFPTNKDAWVISTKDLLNDLTEELERVE